jgi:hypothetical protein
VATKEILFETDVVEKIAKVLHFGPITEIKNIVERRLVLVKYGPECHRFKSNVLKMIF